ncbi:AraC family transcriptional regulator [Puteibacter caeruleilacunae]|nr:AraC family transcriptional regulator [Puteibacter caeruleilacunae]
MGYHWEMSQSNIEELAYEGRLILDIENYFDGKSKLDRKEKLGVANYNVDNFNGYSIIEWDSMFKDNVKISGQTTNPMFALHFMLNGETDYVIDTGRTRVIGGENNVWSLSAGHSGYTGFMKDVYNSSFGIILHDEFLQELTNKFPDLLSNVYRKYENGETFYLNHKHQTTSLEMKQVIAQLKNADVMGRSRDIYAEAKIMELMALQFNQYKGCDFSVCHQHCKRKSDIDKIYEAKQILLSDLNCPPSIKELSLQVGINDKKLKYGFKEVFNQTVYGCLYDYRMEQARKLLFDTDKTIFEVANECGYDYASHFTTAFKRKFGLTPRQFKNNMVAKN